MKKIIALLLILCFTVSLSGCSFDPLAMFNLNGKGIHQKANKENRQKSKDNKEKDNKIKNNNKKQDKTNKN